MGPDAKPIPEIDVKIRSRPLLSAEQIVRGKFLKAGYYGPDTKTDAEGRLVIMLPGEPEWLSFNIISSGYGPYWAEWNSRHNPQPIPAKFTAELEPAWSVGGIVVDQDGRPVKDAKVHPSIRFKKRPGDENELHIGDVLTTDAQRQMAIRQRSHLDEPSGSGDHAPQFHAPPAVACRAISSASPLAISRRKGWRSSAD